MSRATPLLLLALLLPVAVVAADRDEGLTRMMGVWQLDSRASDDPQRTLRQARLAAPPPRSDERRKEEDPLEGIDALERRVAEAVRGDAVLTFAWEPPGLRITYWDDRQRRLTVDGRPEDVATEAGAARQEAAWKGSDRLVVKTEGPAERKIEIYELGDRGDKLFVTVELYRKGRKQPFSWNRVYHRVTGSG